MTSRSKNARRFAWGLAPLFAGCLRPAPAASAESRPSLLASPSQEECDALHDALMDEEQRAVKEWGARVEAARGTEALAAIVAEGEQVTRRYLPRFLALAEQGCGQAKLEWLDLLAHLEPLPEVEVARAQPEVDLALRFLADIVRDHADAWWISNAGDDDVVRYFLRSARRDEACALFLSLVERTTDEEARRSVLLELGVGLLREARAREEREDALVLLERVVASWPESQEADQARIRLRFERRFALGQPVPALRGRDVDGREVVLEPGRVTIVDVFGFWCGPCRAGIPRLRELARRFPDDVAILGIDAYDDEQAFRRGRDELGVAWPCIFDGPEAPLAKELGVVEFPVVLVLDREGILRAKNPAPEELAGIVAALVEG